MFFLSHLSCGPHSISEVSLPTPPSPTLSGSDSWTSADESPAPLRLVKTFPSITSRPTDEEFQTPKRRHSFPTVAIGRRLNMLSWGPTATTKQRSVTGDVLAGKKMAALSRLIRTNIDAKLSKNNRQWLSRTWSKKLLEKEDIGAALKQAKRNHPEWRNSISRLIDFVRNNPQLFAMLVYTKNEKLLDQFCGKGMGDDKFPVKFMQTDTSIESTKGNTPIKLELRSKIDTPGAFTLFDYWQWLFFVPQLHWSIFDHPPLDSKCVLPFLTLEEKSRTEFSIVYKGVIHRDHIVFGLDGIVSAQTVAFTSFQSIRPNTSRCKSAQSAAIC